MEDKAYEILLGDFDNFLKTQQPGGGTYEVSEHGVSRKLVLNFSHVTYIRLESTSVPHTEGFPSRESSFPYVSVPTTSTPAADEDRPLAQPTPASPKKPIL